MEKYPPITTKSPELTSSNFRRCLQQLQDVDDVVIYLIDITNFHRSFITALKDTIVVKFSVILALKKVDVLPTYYKEARDES